MNSPSRTIRVLLVDDEPGMADMVADFLEREDDRFVVETATSAEEGLARLARDDVDCLVSDYDMPGRDGIDFLRAVRDDHPDRPFILFTGHGSEQVASEALSAGATDYLQKKGGTEQYELLANRIRNVVEQCRASKRAAELDRIRTLIGDINQALIRATSRGEIETRVCAIISETEPYLFAWIGEHDPDTATVEPRASAGVGQDYLDTIDITTDPNASAHGPTARAIRTHEIAVMQNIPENPEYEPWRTDALERGYRSSAAIPLVLDDTLYGVLNVYADRTHAFDAPERELLAELGRDITHALAHQEVQRDFARFRQAVEASGHSIYFTDTDGIIEYVNPAFEETTGYTAQEAIGRNPRILKSGEHGEEFYAELWNTILTGDVWRNELVNTTKSGERYVVDQTIAPVTDEDGDITHFVAVNADVTDHKERERELERKNDRLEEFVGVVSHDLRNPLEVAQGRLTLAREERDSAHLDEAAKALERAETLIDDLLTLAQQGKKVGEMEAIPLAEAVESCWRNVETPTATLHVDVEQTIRADRSRLLQLLENLLRNAVEHGDEDVTVTVGSLDDGFYVADDGPGIPEQERDRVFETGYSTADEGSGFGLQIVKQIVDVHGWEIRLTTSEAGGARFEITGVSA